MDTQNATTTSDVENTAATTAATPTPATQTAPGTQQTERYFTQAELDSIVARRLAKAQRGMPDEAELTAFRAWKGSQQTEQERMSTITQERDTARAELATAKAEVEQYKREKLLLSKGVAPEDADYYAFKIAKLVTEGKTFEQAAEDYFKENQPRKNGAKVDTGGSLSGGNQPQTTNSFMNALIRGAR